MELLTRTPDDIYRSWREIIDTIASYKIGELSVLEKAELTTEALELGHLFRRTRGGNVALHVVGK